MTRGTTPEIVCTLSGVDLENLDKLYVTLRQGNTSLEKSLDDVLIDPPAIHIMLSQEETLSFKSGFDAQIQIRGLTLDGEAWATNICTIPVYPVIKGGVI